jgi:peroxiredoxin
VEPVVVLPQKREAVQRFVAETHLPFEILVDEKREIVKAYGVWHRIGLDAWNIAIR